MSETIFIYTDGGSRGNPGPAGAGAWVTDVSGKAIRKGKKYLGTMTNNEAEYEAVLLGLHLAKTAFSKEERKERSVQILLDSELVARQLSGIYQMKEPRLFPYFVAVSNLRISDFPKLSFCHIPREENKEADALANLAMDEGV
jgi:ribonuclease HI